MVLLAGQASVVTLAWLGCGRIAGVALLNEAKKHDIHSFPGSWTPACLLEMTPVKGSRCPGGALLVISRDVWGTVADQICGIKWIKKC